LLYGLGLGFALGQWFQIEYCDSHGGRLTFFWGLRELLIKTFIIVYV